MSRRVRKHPHVGFDGAQRDFVKLIGELARGPRSHSEVFDDFLETAFCAIAQATRRATGDTARADGLEARYMRLVEKRDADYVRRLPELLGHSVEAVADPRVEWNNGAYGVRDWVAPSGTVTGGAHPSKGVFSVADPRVAIEGVALHENKHHVIDWDAPAKTVIGKPQPSSGGPAVADPRLAFNNADAEWAQRRSAWHGVLDWDQPAHTISGKPVVGAGAYSVADPRDRGFVDGVRILTIDEAMALELDVAKPPPFLPVIVAEDGTWHRPMTPLECAALQSYPTMVRGEPVCFDGGRTLACEHVGNSVPPDAAKAIGERMLVALIEADLGAFSLASGSEPVWVTPMETLQVGGAA